MSRAIANKQSEQTTILICNLSDETSEEDIRSLFGQYGTVSDVRLILSAANRRGDGCCYLKMRARRAEAAISALDRKTCRGSILSVRETHVQSNPFSEPRRAAEDELTRTPTRPVYEVASVEKAAMPADAGRDDWYRYVLSSGNSRITGFHRGTRAEVEEYASHCAEEFNLRSSRGKKSTLPMTPGKKK